MHPSLALSEKSIVLPEAKLPQFRDVADLYDRDGGGYEMREDEIAVDLFCGAGGTSEGIRQALGESPMFALNHNPVAIGVHDANHPETVHLLSDVFAMNPAHHIPAGKQIGLLTASPSCVHFSTARSGKPLDREIRDQAWVIANWCEHPNQRFRPRVVMVENVREFLTWAPLNAKNKIDKRFIDKNGLGSTFKEWRDRILRAGYTLEYRVLNAADYGVATKRRRLIIIARRDGLPIRFPKVTHGPRKSPEVLAGLLKPYDSAGQHIDFTIQCNPIFMYQEDAKRVGANRPLASNSLRRIAAGVERYVLDSEDPYIISYGGGLHAKSIGVGGKPVANEANRFALISPVVSPITHSGPGRYYDMDSQLPTFTCARRGEFGLIQSVCAIQTLAAQQIPVVVPMRRETLPLDAAGPIPALTSKSQMAIAVGGFSISKTDASVHSSSSLLLERSSSPFLIGAGGGSYAGKPRSIDGPIGTLTCDSRQAVIIPSFAHLPNKSDRPVDSDCAISTNLNASNDNIFNIATLIQVGYGERNGQAPRILDIREPAGTFVTECSKHAIVSASLLKPPRVPFHAVSSVAVHMAQHNADNVGHSITEPLSTMTAKVCHQNLVASHLVTFRQNTIGQSLEDPIPTLCSEGTHIGEVRTCLVKYYGQGSQSQSSEVPLGTLTAKARFAVIQAPVESLGLTEEQRFEAWWIARFLEIYGTRDMGNPCTAHLEGPRPSAVGRPGAILWTVEMRMLKPKEAFSASSFPADYEFERMADGKKVSISDQMALVGNAVPPGLARAAISANCKPKRSLRALMAA